MQKLTIAKFIEGSYIPSFDGASSKFSKIPKILKQFCIDMIVFHCYRGWSDLDLIKDAPFITYALPPEIFYGKRDILLKILSKEKIDVIEFNDIETIISIGAFLSYELNCPITYDVHIISSEIEKFLSPYSSYETTRRLEEKIKDFVSAASCLTMSDACRFIEITSLDKNRVFVIPMCIDPNETIFRGPAINSNVVLFIGNLFYEPNVRAVETIAKIIYPETRKQIPDIKFWVVGDTPIYLYRKYQNKDFRFKGRIKDLNKVFKYTKVALAPIDIGGGMRVKILHYMAAGIPTISTTIARDGIKDRKWLIVQDDFYKYPNKISTLFRDNSLGKRIGVGLRNIIERNYSWVSIGESFYKFYLFAKNNPIHIKKIKSIVFKQPSWLEETISKKRFTPKALLSSNYYLRLGKGKADQFKV